MELDTKLNIVNMFVAIFALVVSIVFTILIEQSSDKIDELKLQQMNTSLSNQMILNALVEQNNNLSFALNLLVAQNNDLTAATNKLTDFQTTLSQYADTPIAGELRFGVSNCIFRAFSRQTQKFYSIAVHAASKYPYTLFDDQVLASVPRNSALRSSPLFMRGSAKMSMLLASLDGANDVYIGTDGTNVGLIATRLYFPTNADGSTNWGRLYGVDGASGTPTSAAADQFSFIAPMSSGF